MLPRRGVGGRLFPALHPVTTRRQLVTGHNGRAYTLEIAKHYNQGLFGVLCSVWRAGFTACRCPGPSPVLICKVGTSILVCAHYSKRLFEMNGSTLGSSAKPGWRSSRSEPLFPVINVP